MKQPRVNVSRSIAQLKRDVRMGPLIEKVKRPVLEYSDNPFRSLARAIIFQQLSGKAATSIFEKFVALYKRKVFPTPNDVLKTERTVLRSVGLSNQKINYLYDLSLHFESAAIIPERFVEMSDEEIIAQLLLVKGIGKWTVDMFLIFALNRPNVLPVGDLGIKKGFRVAFGLQSLPSEKTMQRLAKPYEGNHTMFSLYLWKIADQGNPHRPTDDKIKK